MPDQNPNPFLPPDTITETPSSPGANSFWNRFNFSKKWLAGVIVLIVLLLALAVWVTFLKKAQNGQPDVQVAFDASQSIIAGSFSEFYLVYENHESRGLEQVNVEVVYPEGFHFNASDPTSGDGLGRSFSLGSVAAGGSGKIKISGIFNGSPQEVKTLRARIFFHLTKITAEFSAEAQVQISLEAPNFNLRISSPSQLVNAQRLDYNITFKNISDTDLDRVQLRLAYPAGFIFSKSSILSPDNKIWEIGHFPVGSEISITVSGTLSGDPGADKTLQADLGYIDESGNFVQQSRAYSTTKILDSPLSVTQTTNFSDAVNEGENMTYNFNYVNNGTEGLQNVQIVLKLEGDAINFASVKTPGGALVGKNVIWNPSGVPGLQVVQPGEQGQLTLSFNLKKDLAKQGLVSPKFKSSLFVSSAEYPEPIPGPWKEFKIRSKLALEVSAQHFSGPNPPVADQTSVYLIRLRVSSAFNEAQEVNLQSIISVPTVNLTADSVSPAEAANFNFALSSGRINWNIKTLSPYASREITFKVDVSPSVADEIRQLPLLKSIQVSGRDMNTGTDLLTTADRDLLIIQ